MPVHRAVGEFGEESLDVCLIDGEHRGSCALAVLPKLSTGCLLLLDNAQCFLDHSTRSPHFATAWARSRGVSRVGELVATWRLIWTSDGYSDAAIWIKP